MVDFGHCFLYNMWTKQDLVQHENDGTIMGLFPFIQNQIVDMGGFLGWFDALECVRNAEIDGILDSIPSYWPVDAGEKQSLRRFIKLRRQAPRRVICDRKDLFNHA